MNKNEILRRLPSVDSVLRDKELETVITPANRVVAVELVRKALDDLREQINTSSDNFTFHKDSFLRGLKEDIEKADSYHLKRVVNATGIILHTNLGRATLPHSALRNIAEISCCYNNLEYDLVNGKRGERYAHLDDELCRLTGAEAAVVVNNNAAAVFISLNTISDGREVIVSRGELVEIGGSFRIPDIMKKSGARLVEVGTTNRVYVSDFEKAISSETSLFLKVHRSNFEIVGFTSDIELSEISELGKRFGIPVMYDLGSGTLIDLSMYGFRKEPTVQDAINSGADIVTFSGDKLLGGPQAGIIAGKREIVDSIKKNPLMRAFRIDKLTVAALEATLRLYRDHKNVENEIPVIRMLTRPSQDIKKSAMKLFRSLKGLNCDLLEINVREGSSQAGGGAMPHKDIPTWLVTVQDKRIPCGDIERMLRLNTIPIMARIEKDEVIFDVRSMLEGDAQVIIEFFRKFILQTSS